MAPENNMMNPDADTHPPMLPSEYFPYVLGSKAESYDWKRIDDPESRDRTYFYRGITIEVKDVLWISVKKTEIGHSHRLHKENGESLYMTAGWVCVKWKGKFQF